MSTNEILNRLNSSISISSHSAINQTKLKIPPAFVPDEWVCNHNHKRHSHANNIIKHKYVRPAKRAPININTAIECKKSTRVLSPILASPSLKATPSNSTNKSYFKVERKLELSKIKKKIDNQKLEKDEAEKIKVARERELVLENAYLKKITILN